MISELITDTIQEEYINEKQNLSTNDVEFQMKHARVRQRKTQFEKDFCVDGIIMMKLLSIFFIYLPSL